MMNTCWENDGKIRHSIESNSYSPVTTSGIDRKYLCTGSPVQEITEKFNQLFSEEEDGALLFIYFFELNSTKGIPNLTLSYFFFFCFQRKRRLLSKSDEEDMRGAMERAMISQMF